MEVIPSHRRVVVTESSQVSAARFAAHDAAGTAAFEEEDVYRSGLVATELATNLVKHATGGEMLVRLVSRVPVREIELIALDRGPGISDVLRSLSDGHSTAGSPGTGLGAIQRMADQFDIYSQIGRGTVILARLRGRRAARARRSLVDVAGVSVAMPGEVVCGDAWQVAHHADGALVTVVDGLGHGLHADEASTAAIASLDPRRNGSLTTHLQVMHDGLRHTRGAAGALAQILPLKRLMNFAGIGNIAASIWGSSIRRAVSLAGTLGHEARSFREYSYPWEPQAVAVIHSDGLGTHWSLDDHRGLRQHDPAVIAAALYRDFGRPRDDVTVVVGKEAA